MDDVSTQVSKLHLHACSPTESEILSLVANACFLEAFADDLDAADLLAHCLKNNSAEAFQKYLAQPSTRIVTAEIPRGAAPIGYSLCCEPELPSQLLRPGDYELKRIYLLHRFQGLGIGRALMDEAIGTARAIGRARLLLGVYSENRDALQFYSRTGFEKIGDRTFQVGSTQHHDFVLALNL